MIGKVDNSGRALLSVELRPEPLSAAATMDVWIDTGFTGDLVLPQTLIDKLRLPKSGSVDAILADGSQIELFTHAAKSLSHTFVGSITTTPGPTPAIRAKCETLNVSRWVTLFA